MHTVGCKEHFCVKIARSQVFKSKLPSSSKNSSLGWNVVCFPKCEHSLTFLWWSSLEKSVLSNLTCWQSWTNFSVSILVLAFDFFQFKKINTLHGKEKNLQFKCQKEYHERKFSSHDGMPDVTAIVVGFIFPKFFSVRLTCVCPLCFISNSSESWHLVFLFVCSSVPFYLKIWLMKSVKVYLTL